MLEFNINRFDEHSFRRKRLEEKDNEDSNKDDLSMMQSVKIDEKDITKDNNDENMASLSNTCDFDFDAIVSTNLLIVFIKYIHICIIKFYEIINIITG